MLIDQIPDFTINQNGYDYETSLSAGFHFIECPQCHCIHTFLVVPTKEGQLNKVQTLEISDDPRFPSYLSIRCRNCKVDIQFCTGDESDNPFIEDPMLINSLEEWR